MSAEKHREMMRWPMDRLRAHRQSLIDSNEVVRNRAAVASDDTLKIIVGGLKERLAAIRSTYVTVAASASPNVVVASLAALQGQEREVDVQLNIWEGAKERKKTLDDSLRICEEVIAEKQEIEKHNTRS